MFLKPLKIRSQHQLKTSDKKRLIEDLCKQLPVLTHEKVQHLFPKREDVLLFKIETGSKLLIPVYVVNDQPLLFIYNQRLIPTLHMLWKCPNSIFAFKTHGEVVKKLVGGADLMLPGVIEPSASKMPIFYKDIPASVSSNETSVSVVVGVTACTSVDMMSSSKGKCLYTLHVIGDKLYNLKNTTSNIPSPFQELLILMKKCQIQDVDLNSERKYDYVQNENQNVAEVEGDDGGECVKALTENESQPSSVEEMDALLMHSLFVAIKYSKGLHFPILTSNFFKTHMVPACPQNKVLDVKKSSFKKCGHFMKHMMELDVLKVEEQKKGIEYITEFNNDHPLIREFYLDPSNRPKDNKEMENSVKPVITEAHSITAAVLPIFSKFNLKKGSVIDNSEIRKLVTQYVKQHNLQDENSKNFINLNDDLRSALKLPRCTFEELIKEVYSLMSPCYKIICGECEIIHKGKLEAISITVAKRSGNKKITLVDNVETYGINITELANICQHGTAASSTIIRSENPRKSAQLLIQGNQVLFVYNLLTEKCLIPKRFVRGLEFAPKK